MRDKHCQVYNAKGFMQFDCWLNDQNKQQTGASIHIEGLFYPIFKDLCFFLFLFNDNIKLSTLIKCRQQQSEQESSGIIDLL